MVLTGGQTRDGTGARALLGDLPMAPTLRADRGSDANGVRKAWKDKGIRPCNPSR